MKRLSLPLLIVTLMCLTACETKTEEMAMSEPQPYEPLSTLDTEPADTTYANDPYAGDPFQTEGFNTNDNTTYTPPPTYTSATTDTSNEETLIDSNTTGLRTHTVRKGDTLFKLARQYYNDETRWRDIWDANRDKIKDKNHIEVGMVLVIP